MNILSQAIKQPQMNALLVSKVKPSSRHVAQTNKVGVMGVLEIKRLGIFQVLFYTLEV
jgi:hypothetical protein